MVRDVVIVGSGMAGLTAGVYLARNGHSVLICEQSDRVGGLVGSFTRDGFLFDSGIRATEDSGVLLPMLRDLGIDLEYAENPVSIGLGDDVIRLGSDESIDDYESFLKRGFPELEADVDRIIKVIRRIMHHMEVLYGIENPAFIDLQNDRKYLRKTFLPWLMRFPFTIGKIARLRTPIDEYIRKLTDDPQLIDYITQHFFEKIPAFFALSYFSLYLDYRYPIGGTGELPEALRKEFLRYGGEIRLGSRIESVEVENRRVLDSSGDAFEYRYLLWAADQKRLYNAIDTGAIIDPKVRRRVADRAREISGNSGGNSVFTLYLAVDLDPEYFASISTGHCFYTPDREGLSSVDRHELDRLLDQAPSPEQREHAIEVLDTWLRSYFTHNTFEIAIPALRDANLAPPGKTALIISTLFDFDIVELAEKIAWYDEFKLRCEQAIIDTISSSLYPGLDKAILFKSSSTPATIARTFGTADGAITGWAFTDATMPAEYRFLSITNSVRTPIPHVYQAGQWTYTPAGLPIAILTGKFAADRINKVLHKSRRVP